MKKFTSFLLALVLVFSLSVTAFAASDIGVVEYTKKGFSFLPGYEDKEADLSYPTDLFPELKNVMPGDVLHQEVKIYHKADRHVDIRVYIKAEGSNLNPDFIEQMQLQVQHKGGDILYDEPEYDATEKSGWKRLATLSHGKSATLDLTLTVPKEMDNAYADQLGTVVWKFKVEEIPVDPDAPKTGDDSNIAVWTSVLALSAAALVVLVVAKKKRKQ